MKTTTDGDGLRDQPAQGVALVGAGRAQLEDHPARLDDQAGLARRGRAERAAQQRRGRPAGRRSAGCAPRPRVPLSSTHVPSGAPASASTPGSRASDASTAARSSRRVTAPPPPTARARSGRARRGAGTPAIAAYSTASPAGRPVTTATRTPAVGEPGEHLRDVGVSRGPRRGRGRSGRGCRRSPARAAHRPGRPAARRDRRGRPRVDGSGSARTPVSPGTSR